MKVASTVLSGVLGACACPGPAAFGQEPAPEAGVVARVAWRVELGAESLQAAPPAGPVATTRVVASVPGAAYVFDRASDGRLAKRARLPADSAAANGTAVSGTGLALADRLGTVSLWEVPAAGELRLRWRRDLGERVTSIAWDGGPLVLAATWGGRLIALATEDGRPRWSAEIGGRADAPAVADGRSVYVATKARTLLRIDARTGAVRWRAALPGVVLHRPGLAKEPATGASPQRTRQVLVGTWDGQLVAVDALTGRSPWTTPLEARLASAPLVTPELVAVVTADGTARAYDLSGHALWTAPDAALGPATLIWQQTAGAAPRLLSVSGVLAALSPSMGERSADYPRGSLDELRRRFADAMLEGIKTYSGAEKQALQEREAFDIAGPLFGPARVFGDASTTLAFGTEEGWVYAFDATSLRPLARYHAGPAAAAAQLAGDRVVATTGEDVYALDAGTGGVLWKRTVGGDPSVTAGGDTLAVRAGGRVHAITTADGGLGWTFKESVRAVVPAAPRERSAAETPWLAADEAGGLRALVAPGRYVGDPLPVEGELLALLAIGPRSWLAASREGGLFGVEWEEAMATEAAKAEEAATRPVAGRLSKTWEMTWDEPLSELYLAGGRALVRTAAGVLASVDLATRQEIWRQALAPDERVVASRGAVLVLGKDAVRVHEAETGVLKHRQALALPALAADVRGELPPALGLPFGGGELRWLDRLGRAHRAALGGERAATTDLGLTLKDAAPVEAGFLATTAAGEVALVTFDREE